MLQVTPLNPAQRGFINADRCSENLFLLRQLVYRMGKPVGSRIKRLDVAFLDLAKAFDTVSHSLVFAGMRKLGFHDHMVDVVNGLYEGCATKFSVRAESSGLIDIRRGVRQGDVSHPSSSILPQIR